MVEFVCHLGNGSYQSLPFGTVGPEDYTATVVELMINSNTTRVCMTVPIITDSAVEGLENFTALLFNNASEDDLRITLEPQHTSIIIMDTSGKYCALYPVGLLLLVL